MSPRQVYDKHKFTTYYIAVIVTMLLFIELLRLTGAVR